MIYKSGDIVLFKTKENIWKEGKVICNNFAMCNLSDFTDPPCYLIEEIVSGDMFEIEKDSDRIKTKEVNKKS